MCAAGSLLSCQSRRPAMTWARMRPSCEAVWCGSFIEARGGCAWHFPPRRDVAPVPSTIVANNAGEVMDARRFEGKVALVTGGNSGIGLAVAKGLVDEGARVVIVGRNAETVTRRVGELGASAHGVVADTARLDEFDRVLAATRDFGGGRLDVVFANAGVGTFGPLSATTEAMWDTMVDINVKGVYFTVQKAVPLMKPGGAIVLNASVAAAKGNPIGSVYGASKAAVRSFARTIGAEL